MLVQDYDIKYQLSKFVPIRFRNAVLHEFTVMQNIPQPGYGRDGVIIRLSYYHLKKKTTLNYQQHLTEDDLEGNTMLYVAERMVRELKIAAYKKD